MLFNLYILGVFANFDFPVRFLGFADDIVMYSSGPDPQAIIHLLKEAFDSIHPLLISRRLPVSLEKCKLVNFGLVPVEPGHFQINLGATIIFSSCVMRYLGVIMSQGLSWEPHIESIIPRMRAGIAKVNSGARFSWGPTLIL